MITKESKDEKMSDENVVEITVPSNLPEGCILPIDIGNKACTTVVVSRRHVFSYHFF